MQEQRHILDKDLRFVFLQSKPQDSEVFTEHAGCAGRQLGCGPGECSVICILQRSFADCGLDLGSKVSAVK